MPHSSLRTIGSLTMYYSCKKKEKDEALAQSHTNFSTMLHVFLHIPITLGCIVVEQLLIECQIFSQRFVHYFMPNLIAALLRRPLEWRYLSRPLLAS